MAKSYGNIDLLNTFKASKQCSTAWDAAIPFFYDGDEAKASKVLSTVVFNNPALYNELLFGMTQIVFPRVISDEMYKNHFGFLKMAEGNGLVEESVTIIPHKAVKFDPNAGASEAFGNYNPKYIVQYHQLNVQYFCPVTVQKEEYLGAIEKGALSDWANKLIQGTVEEAETTEENLIKYLVARKLINGQLAVVVATDENVRRTTAKVKSITSKMGWKTSVKSYNLLGSENVTRPENLTTLMSADFNADNDVDVLAQAFNMDKATFLGQQFVVDSFGAIDLDRVQAALGSDYIELQSSDLTDLDKVCAILGDRRWFYYRECISRMEDDHVGVAMKDNYSYHRHLYLDTQDAFSMVALVNATPSVTSVTVSPSTATLAKKGDTVSLDATVVTANFAPKAVIWSTADPEKATVDAYGNVTRTKGAIDTATTVVITATSKFDSTKTDTATITLAAEE